MNILLLGSNGFIGARLARALSKAGHTVTGICRADGSGRQSPVDHIALDFDDVNFNDAAFMQRIEPAVTAADAVINCAGILKEQRPGSFDRVHAEVPRRVFEAAVASGAKQLIQVSALGQRAAGEFIASKHRLDDDLMASGWPVTVLRPSVILDPAQAYGGTRLMRSIASLPVLPVIAGNSGYVQPLLLDDLCRLIVRLLSVPPSGPRLFELGGPHVIPINELLLQLRHWLGIQNRLSIRIPHWLMSLSARAADRLRLRGWSSTIQALLMTGNTVTATQNPWDSFGVEQQVVNAAFQPDGATPAAVRDARLGWLIPLLRWALIVVFTVSGLLGLAIGPSTVEALLGSTDWVTAARIGGVLDLLLAAGWLVAGRWGFPPLESVARLSMLLILLYTAGLTLMRPGLWLSPMGGLLKNLVILPVCWLYTDRRTHCQ